MVIGVDSTTSPKGGFHETVSRIANAFAGSIAVVAARGRHDTDPTGPGLNILVPVTGNEVSRRGAEIAVALAGAAKSPVTVLSVVSAGANNERDRLVTARRDAAEAIKEIKAIADFHAVPMKSSIRTDISAEDAILRQARRGKHDLIVLGVSRRPGKALSFGDVATALLESSDRSLMFVAPLPAVSARRAANANRATRSETKASAA
jgi:nucleotide-binding universal stress UspA family protein